MLNFYAKKWRSMNEETKENQINVPVITFPNHERTLASILEVTDSISKISPIGAEKRR